MKKIVMFTGGIETQEYFTLQLANTFEGFGHGLFLYRLNEGDSDYPSLCHFIEADHTVMITFNFHGLNLEEPFYQNEVFFWEIMNVPCINIVLDHPFYYHKFLEFVPPLYTHISIDLAHENYMKRFFPHIKRGPFLPLAGTEIQNKPLKDRSIDIVFTGNYTPPQQFEKHITRIDDEYTKFYYGIIDDLITHPMMGMEDAFEQHLRREIHDLSEEDLKTCMENMIFIDLYVRFYFRGLVVRTLVDHGFPVHIYGSGWNHLECKHPNHIILGGPVSSRGCLDAISNSRISLNVMPWFKNGAHDRIFNSMLNGAVCFSDDSIWLRENLIDGTDLIFYSLSDINLLPSSVEQLLSDPNKLEEIARNGYQKANALHTWACRAKVLEKYINFT